jgi:hypothetical protein
MHDPARLYAPLHAALAVELRDLRLQIEGIAALMVGDEALALTYIEQFQDFDLIIQRAEESARLLDSIAGGRCPHDAVEQVRLSAVQDRLRTALRAA